MTSRKILLASALLLAGCASSTDEPTHEDDAHFESTDEAPAPGDAEEISEAEEPSASWLDEGIAANDDATEGDLEPLSPEDMQATSTCHHVTGYRNGNAFSICITTVDGHSVEVKTARAYLRMKRAARGKGVYLHINSGFRTMAQQRYLYHCYVTKSCNGGNLAAYPGYSNHQSGHALDLNTTAPGVYTWLANHGSAYGFHRTVPSERWHWEH